jgi:hypothetical protein
MGHHCTGGWMYRATDGARLWGVTDPCSGPSSGPSSGPGSSITSSNTQALYISYFNRPADTFGQSYFLSQIPDLGSLGFKPEDFGLKDFSLFQNQGFPGFGRQNFGLPGFGLQNFAAEPKSDITSRADGAFAALGYAGRNKEAANSTNAPAQPGREWNAWVNVGGGEFKVRDTSG